jgi:hypothetical protein
VADQLLDLGHVGGHHVRLGAHRLAQRLAVGVDHRDDVRSLQLADQQGVDVRLQARWQRPSEHHDRRAAGQV